MAKREVRLILNIKEVEVTLIRVIKASLDIAASKTFTPKKIALAINRSSLSL